VLTQWFSYRKKNRERPIIGDRRLPSEASATNTPARSNPPPASRRGPATRTPTQRPGERSLRPHPRRSRPPLANRPTPHALHADELVAPPPVAASPTRGRASPRHGFSSATPITTIDPRLRRAVSSSMDCTRAIASRSAATTELRLLEKISPPQPQAAKQLAAQSAAGPKISLAIGHRILDKRRQTNIMASCQLLAVRF